MPFVLEEHGSFCCGTTSVPSTSNVCTMQRPQSNQQLTMSSVQSSIGPAPSAMATDSAALGSLFERISLSGVTYATQSHNYLSAGGEASSPVVNMSSGFSQNSSSAITMANQNSNDDFQSQQNMAVNFRLLQNRELGGKGGGVRDSRPFLSSSAPDEMGTLSEMSMSSTAGPSVSFSDTMDLDSALDELGMLSTVTNSRRQYLLEARGQESDKKREQRLRSKSESSSNLGLLNGYRIIQLDSNYVTGVCSSTLPSGASLGAADCKIDDHNSLSTLSRLEYRNPDMKLENSAIVQRRRSVPRMSRFRKDRYRRSRCPYKIPKRLCHSMQESNLGPGYFESCPSTYIPPSTSAPESLAGSLLASRLRADPVSQLTTPGQSKSNTSSPAKPPQEIRLVRSLSAEDLAPVRRRLEHDLNTSRTEESLDLMTTQLTSLHMS